MLKPKVISGSFAAALASLAVVLASCGDDAVPPPENEPGAVSPIEGQWRLQEVRCDGLPILGDALGFTIFIQGDRFETTLPDGPDCSVTFRASATYPEEGTVVVRDEATACSPDACSESCGASAAGETETLQYDRDGDSLTFKSTAEDSEGFCSAGEETELRLRRSEG